MRSRSSPGRQLFLAEGRRDLCVVVNDEWVTVKLDVKGKHAVLNIGDFRAEISHAALAREKNTVMLTFAHGEIAVRNFSFSPASDSVSRPVTP